MINSLFSFVFFLVYTLSLPAKQRNNSNNDNKTNFILKRSFNWVSGSRFCFFSFSYFFFRAGGGGGGVEGELSNLRNVKRPYYGLVLFRKKGSEKGPNVYIAN